MTQSVSNIHIYKVSEIMNTYKEAYKILLEGVNEALEKADREIKEHESGYNRGKQYEIYGILCHAQREAEEKIISRGEKGHGSCASSPQKGKNY